jgi:hypothetical protein
VLAYLALAGAMLPGPGRAVRVLAAMGPVVLGWGLACGWLALFSDYMTTARRAQETAYTIPLAEGVSRNLARLVACAYHACTVWLPYTLLLPYWLVLGAGFLHPARAAGRGSLHGLLLAVVLPSLVVVSATIMHKRTGSFLLPAAAAWFGLGIEVIVERAGLQRRRFGVVAAVALALALNLTQAARVMFFETGGESGPASPTYVAGGLLSRHADEVGPVWAFGGEPEVYTFWNKPILYDPWWRPDEAYAETYARNRGNPAEFVAELRRRGCRYLTFVRSVAAKSGGAGEGQPYCPEARLPLRRDLDTLVESPAANGLALLGHERLGDRPECVYVFKIM